MGTQQVSFRHFIEPFEITWEKQQDISYFKKPYNPRQIEIFTPSEYYGFDLIVKGFLGLNPNLSLKFGLSHSVDIGDGTYSNQFGFRTQLSTHVYYNNIGLRNIINHKVPGWAIHAAHPIVILNKMMLETGLQSFEKFTETTLFFPAHRDKTHNFVNKQYDEDICLALEKQREIVGDIHISMQSDDILLGRNEIYESRGFRVVSSGHRHDPYFLSRFVNLVSRYNQVATSEIGSHIFYTTHLGAPSVFWDMGLPVVQLIDTPRALKDPFTLDSSVINLFHNDKTLSIDIAKEFLGVSERNISADHWRYIHEKSINRDRYAILVPVSGKWKLSLPSAVRRYLKREFMRINGIIFKILVKYKIKSTS